MAKRKRNGNSTRRKRTRFNSSKRVYGGTSKRVVTKKAKSNTTRGGKKSSMNMIRQLRKAVFGTHTSTWEGAVLFTPDGTVDVGAVPFYHYEELGGRPAWSSEKPLVYALSNPFAHTLLGNQDVKDTMLYSSYVEPGIDNLDAVRLAGDTNLDAYNNENTKVRKYQMERTIMSFHFDTTNYDSMSTLKSGKIHFCVVEVHIQEAENVFTREIGEYLKYYIEGRKYPLDKQYKVLNHQVYNPMDVSNRKDLVFRYSYKPMDCNIEYYKSTIQNATNHSGLGTETYGRKFRVACIFPEDHGVITKIVDHGWERIKVTKIVKFSPIVQTLEIVD